MQLQAVSLLLVGLGLIAKTSSVPLSADIEGVQVHFLEGKTGNSPPGPEVRPPTNHFGVSRFYSHVHDEISIKEADSKVEIKTSHTQNGGFYVTYEGGAAAMANRVSEGYHIERQKLTQPTTDSFDLDGISSATGGSAAHVTSECLKNSNLGVIESPEGSANREPPPRAVYLTEQGIKRRTSEDRNHPAASAKPELNLISKRDTLDSISASKSISRSNTVSSRAPEPISSRTYASTRTVAPDLRSTFTSTTPLPNATKTSASDGGKGHISNISLRVDVPQRYFLQNPMKIECRQARHTYNRHLGPPQEDRGPFFQTPDFLTYPSVRAALQAIRVRVTSCIELCLCSPEGRITINRNPVASLPGSVGRGRGDTHACNRRPEYPDECAIVYGCFCTAPLVDNPDTVPGATVADYQEALDRLPETVKNDNEGFLFNAGSRVGGPDEWIGFTEARRLFPGGRPVRPPGAPPRASYLDFEIPPEAVQEGDPMIDADGFQNWFNPGNNFFNSNLSRDRGKSRGMKHYKEPGDE
ncbi:hypothetical protein TWF718_000505 [Orbilia javanica]|uniref:Uncharacterized protein n=1 Tax=Orbilia javanica TaxID=47235 RepID=A0AAN8N7H4_9PEZI